MRAIAFALLFVGMILNTPYSSGAQSVNAVVAFALLTAATLCAVLGL